MTVEGERTRRREPPPAAADDRDGHLVAAATAVGPAQTPARAPRPKQPGVEDPLEAGTLEAGARAALPELADPVERVG